MSPPAKPGAYLAELEMSTVEPQPQSDVSLAWEEVKLLQEIAKNQEDWRFKIRGWAMALVTALSVAAFSSDVRLSGSQYFMLSVVILLVTCWLDVIYRVAQNRALDRAGVVEKHLRGEGDYDGPKITESLSKPSTMAAQLTALTNVRVYGPYVFLFIAIGLIAYVA